jgi:limonene-1,2-epoxide hydrolase
MTPTEVVHEFIARITRLDVDGACELVDPEVEYDNVPMGKVQGPEGIKSVFSQMSGMIDAMEFVTHRETAVGDLVLNERTDRFRKDGKWAELPVAGVFEVHDGRITLWRDYFDLATMTNQFAEIAS